MTLNDLYKATLPFVFESPNSTEYDSYLIPYVNLLLQQNFELNNSVRKYKELDELSTAQTLTAKGDELLFEPELTREVLPLGLAALLIKEDDMMTTGGKIYNDYMSLYTKAQDKHRRATSYDIEDIYDVDSED